MIIRLVIENLFSFGERKEFNTIPNKRLKTLDHHKYSFNGFDILKISSIYGANGAGKSNLIKSLELFQKLIIKERIPSYLRESKFKFNTKDDKQNQVFAIEFVQDSTAFYYGIILNNGVIATEELYLSGMGKDKDKLLYERKTDENGNTNVIFLKDFEQDEKSQVLKSVLLEEFVKSDEPILQLISNRDNEYLKDVKLAYKWFDETLQIITPFSKPNALAHKIDIDSKFKKYTKDLLCSFNIGITELQSDKKEIKDFFSQDNSAYVEKILEELEKSKSNVITLRNNAGDELVITKEDEKVWVKKLKIGHTGKQNKQVLFDLYEESDGTVRLLDFIPAFQQIISSPKVYIIDEIERSIHPLLIKELVQKFSFDPNTKGQLIFTTHESNLLDQKIFRQDEIWFVEKNSEGSTDLYSLSDFKEHKTIDIQKGYLNGRYGSIPFLGNLQDLNWNENDTNE